MGVIGNGLVTREAYNVDVLASKARQITFRNVECCGVLGGGVQSIAQVVEESVALPPEAHLDVRVRHTLAVQEVAGCTRME